MTEALRQLIADFPVYQNVRCGVEVGAGWIPILRDLAPVLVEHGLTVTQAKEKMGGLRVYWEFPSHDGNLDSWRYHPIRDAIRTAEERAWKTCEFCGSQDDVKRAGNWIKTVCWQCRTELLDGDGHWLRRE